ncbi:HU family DNA-binding protein [Spiroplasma endosymbiont of Othius punctulatus]|uniref:HU family DNA-binding protein n=1 Tax=Spiroplasma endosymbiont of Othius punctulatus TaxID=3066289 RepID=UPI0030D33E4B
MTKKELAERLAMDCGTTKSQAEQIINLVFDEIIQSLAKGEEVAIAGFGKLTTLERSAREGINPSTGEKIQIEGKTVAKFKPSKQLKEAISK